MFFFICLIFSNKLCAEVFLQSLNYNLYLSDVLALELLSTTFIVGKVDCDGSISLKINTISYGNIHNTH